jgi:hypothetical protein
MKKLLLVCCALVSLSSIACPNLAGSYSCSEVSGYGTETYLMDIAQSGNEFTTSTDGAASEILVADGVSRQFSTPEVSGTFIASCTAAAVVVEVNAQVKDPSGNVVHVVQSSNMSKGGSTLMIKANSTAYGQTFTSTTTCTLN